MGWLGDAWDWTADKVSDVAAYSPPALIGRGAAELLTWGNYSGTQQDYATGLQRILTGTVGEDPDGDGRYNPSWGDAWRMTADDLSPGYVYRAPEDWWKPGTQHGDSDLADDVREAGDWLKKAAPWLLLGGAALLASR